MAQEKEIKLYSIPEMDLNYDNIPWFLNKGNQTSYFNARLKQTIPANIKVDPTRTAVTIKASYATVEGWNVDYCTITDDSGKLNFYFIGDYIQATQAVTTFELIFDPIQTYMFDITIMPSFVDRCHVPRWKTSSYGTKVPAGGTVMEDLQFGDMVLGDYKTESFRPKYIISSTSMLGSNTYKRPLPLDPASIEGGEVK